VVVVPFLVAAVTCAPAAPPAQPRADRPRYELNVRVTRSLRTVSGDVVVTFTPNRTTDRLVFRLWPNSARSRTEGANLAVGRVTVRGRRARVLRPDATTLEVRTGGLAPGDHVRARIPWTLRVPAARFDRIARFKGGVRLGSFFPILAWDPRRGWVTDPPARILAESSTSPTADFDIRVRVPRGLTAVVSGTPAGAGRWRARALRDVALAVGRFRTATAIAHAPNAVTVRVAVAAGADASARRFVNLATNALAELARRYGPYPWPDYTVVIPPDFIRGGIEYPTLSFVGPKFFVVAVVDHETAHQWFYSLVGNDQARDPWLDETLATWAQRRVDGLVRPPPPDLPAAVRRHVGSPVTYWSRFPQGYFYGVYDEGVNALSSLGDDDAVDCALRHYAARRAYSIAQPRDLLDELNRVIPDAESRLRAWGIHR
jgi:Peptidase family M1 domain